jgi:N-acetylmuramoyl-L-alanine amidase
MSADPIRVDWGTAAIGDPEFPLQQGNRVLESVARQEALRALLAFSDLHEQTRKRRALADTASGREWSDTEEFVRDEVLQLICDRAQSLTGADAVVVALRDSRTENADAGGVEFVCRAAAGPLAVERGVRLMAESELLHESLRTGHLLRCDDCGIDTRAELDFARQIGARSTVLIPLPGTREPVGVLQAFARAPWVFTDHDIGCLDLFAELLLSALKPDKQDRRIGWLSGVAQEVLSAKPAAVPPAALLDSPHDPAPDFVATAGASVLHPAEPDEGAVAPPTDAGLSPAAISGAIAPAEPSISEPPRDAELEAVLIPIALVELPELQDLPEPVPPLATADPNRLAAIPSAIEDSTPFSDGAPVLPFLQRHHLPGGSRPGLRVVVGLIAVAALFSAGVWWGMQVRGKTTTAGIAEGNNRPEPRSVTTPPPPAADIAVPAAGDLLMSTKPDSETVPLTAVDESKLAALPKVTGVRHWSSSLGSTVVIDMEDQVPYEVHRLMAPERIYFDLHDTVLPHEWNGKTMEVGDASLTRVRVAQPVAGVTRVVLDTKDGSNFSVSMESSPYRLVVELKSSSVAKNEPANRVIPYRGNLSVAVSATPAAVKPGHVSPVAAKPADQPLPARTGRLRIVLDAGHGGWDLGTVGRQGLLEKDLVLDVTQRLGKLLQARLGSEVVFTRTGDNYLPLEQRADMANQTQADLFISVHANYSSSAAARGVETYYTNLFSAPGSKEIEKHEDGTFAKPIPVSLSSAGLHEKIEESQRLASSVQRSLYATLAAKSPDIRNRGIKESAFAVLTGTTMPAILTEISFVSSPADERNLQSAAYRQQIAEALYKGIARYQENGPRSKVAQLQKPPPH